MEVDGVAAPQQAKRVVDDDEQATMCFACDAPVRSPGHLEFAAVLGNAIASQLPADADFCSWECVQVVGFELIPFSRADLRALLAAGIASAIAARRGRL